MLADQLYAIVDIEATGGAIGADERMIQIACVLMKNNQVIHRFESLVNPNKHIPRRIQQLTNISNQEVKKAPYFEEIAPTLIRLLEGAIFVAHNVGFDYHFLNEQFTLHGFEELSIAAIDTVELSQILYPKSESFQLEDLAGKLNYDLIDAHDALADAEATAYLFTELFKKAQTLPLVTLEKLIDLAEATTHETALFFINALEEAKKDPIDLADELVIVNDIAIQKPHQKEGVSLVDEAEYPKTKSEKEQYLKEDYSYRPVQAEMMDLVYDYFNSALSIEKCAIEAPPGIGKTLAYLFPASFLAKEKGPSIISTYTTLLQDQIVEEAIPELEKILGRKIKTVLVKSSQHYLSLSVFERWLRDMTGQDPEAFLSMRLLVWLTETQTGDLSAINAGSYLDLEFWQAIRARKNQYEDKHWEEYDFYERVKEASTNAEFIVTNHHFLVHDWQSKESILTNLDQLVIDEAHHFPDIALKASTMTLKAHQLLIELEKMGSRRNHLGIFRLLNDLSRMKKASENDLNKIQRTVRRIKENWAFFTEEFMASFLHDKKVGRSDSNFVEMEFDQNILSIQEKRILKNIVNAMEEFIHVSQELSMKAHAIFKDLGNENQLYLIEWVNLTNALKKWKELIGKLFDSKGNELRWVSFLPGKMEKTFTLHFLTGGGENSFIDYLATQSKIVFTSSSLSYQEKEDYFSEQLRNLPVNYHQLESPFNYGEQVRLLLPKNSIHPKKVKASDYGKLLADRIGEILNGSKVNSIILFRSLKLLEEVYHLLMKDRNLRKHLILAQGISGTRNRILKEFKKSRPGIILGADSFFEGIDLPNQDLELLILTRLPFPAPNTPFMRLKTQRLKEESINPFLGEYLPRAVLKFRQAFGRLIRNQKDRGVMVVLDERFLSANYANAFKKALPKGVHFELLEGKQMAFEIEAFLNKRESTES